MKCHYEVLNVPRDVDDTELKKAYRKLALKWHPDKNPANADQAKEHFQIIQQAYEVLSDPHERSWYNNHREAILKGGLGEDYKDDSIDLFRYFSTSCYKGDGDDEKGFYAVYRKVFETLAAEDAEFGAEDDSDDEAPSFGDSQSSYEDSVHHFYAYWQSYSTKRSFAWLDPYDIRDTPNRRVLRVAEKLNKKVRDKAKRERNEQVRNLVSFVRKRDKRVQAHAAKLAEKAQRNAEKAQERKRHQLQERQRELKESKVSDWSKFSNIESELKNIEANLAAEFGETFSASDSDDEDEIKDSDALYCVACNKIFKTQKAFANHENSKKHRDNLATMTAAMKKEEEDYSSSDEEDQSDDETIDANSKLATDAQMPDFLLNPAKNETKNHNLDDITSDEELNSDCEEVSQKLTNGRSCDDGAKSSMDNGYLFPETSAKANDEESEETSLDELVSDEEDEEIVDVATKNRKSKKSKIVNAQIDSDDASFDFGVGLSKKQRRKKQTFNESTRTKKCPDVETATGKDVVEDAVENPNLETTSVPKKTKGKRAKELHRAAKMADNAKQKVQRGKKDSRKEVVDSELCCVSCKCEFPSKNKLFDHLKKTGHSVHLPTTTKVKKKAGDRKNRVRSESTSS